MLIVLWAPFFAIPAYSLGIGVYGSFSVGGQIAPGSIWDDDWFSDEVDPYEDENAYYESALMRYHVGLVLDTCVAARKLFNYRLEFGYGQRTPRVGQINRSSPLMHDINFINTFGFGLIQKKLVRLWVGPQLALIYSFGEIARGYRIYDEVRLLIGAAAGVNYNPGRLITLFAQASLRFGLLYDECRKNSSISEIGFNAELAITLGVMFRINDEYVRKPLPSAPDVLPEKKRPGRDDQLII